MEEKKYINIDNMATRLCQILKDARESMVDDEINVFHDIFSAKVIIKII